MALPTLTQLELPRCGRSFSLAPGPFPRPQRYWTRDLPWQTRVELRPDRLAAMREAFGCDADTPEADAAFQQFLRWLTEGRLLLRVVPLNTRYPIPPGKTEVERTARLRRWLPPGWHYDVRSRLLNWTHPKRFASPTRHAELTQRAVPLWYGPVCYREFMTYIVAHWGVACWLGDGTIWVSAFHSQ